MKADYTRAIKTVSGRIGKFVHMYVKEGNKAVIKRYVKPKLTENNHDFGSAMKNMVSIWKSCSEGFKRDLKTYTVIRKNYYSGDEIPAYTNFAHFIRILYRFKAENPGIELKTVTKEGLETAGIPIKVMDFVKQGLLEPISDADTLREEW